MDNPPHDRIEMINEPFLKNGSPNTKGGIKTLPFIIANEAFEKLASFGLLSNMILYLTKEFGVDAARGANLIFFWLAATFSTPIVGAFLADSYVGRYRMIIFGCFATLLGMVLLWLTTLHPKAPPSPCLQFSENCKSANGTQFFLLYSSIAFMSIGAGGIRSSSLAFGAEQIGRKCDNNLKNSRILESYFNWYFTLVAASTVVAMTCVVYIQDKMGWKVGFGIPVVFMILSTLSFFLASPFYVKSKPKVSFLTGLAQVVVASYRNRSKVPMHDRDAVYYHEKGTITMFPSQNLSFLNKACTITNPEEDLTRDGKACDPWSLCTVNQVEELKTLIRIIPIWSTGVLASVTLCQGSFSVLQVSTMDRHITKDFEIPAGSFSAFLNLSVITWVALYDRFMIPIASKIKGKPVSLSPKQRMGIGILFSAASMAAFAITESIRREKAIKEGVADNPNVMLHMSAMWIVPHHVLNGLTAAFNGIAQNEFYYTELSKSMSSIASTLHGLGFATGNLMASFIFNMVNEVTERTGKESWVASNINKGHYDYYFWLLSAICLINFVYYLACCKLYEPCGVVGHDISDNDEVIRDGN